jgi:hypothetical protein
MWEHTGSTAIGPLKDFLKSFDRAFESIRMLTFHEVERYHSDYDPAALVIRCPGLQQLDMAIDSRDLTRCEDRNNYTATGL